MARSAQAGVPGQYTALISPSEVRPVRHGSRETENGKQPYGRESRWEAGSPGAVLSRHLPAPSSRGEGLTPLWPYLDEELNQP